MMTEKNNAGEIIFVGGAPRSGTTLLQIMLNSHSKIWGGPEFDNIPKFIDLRNQLRQSVDKKRIDQFCDYKDIDRALAACMLNLIGNRAFVQGCRYVSEKTPGNVLVFEPLMEMFPAARFINVVRDPRAVVSSMLEVGKRARKIAANSEPYTNSTVLACEVVRQSYLAAERAIQKNVDRVMTIRYEEFVTQPKEETRKICDFLGIAWEDVMAQPHTREHGVNTLMEKSNSPFLNPDTYKKAPDLDRINAWAKDLTQNQIAKIELLLGNEARIYGYELKSAHGLAKLVAKVQLIGDKVLTRGLRAIWRIVKYVENIFRKKLEIEIHIR